MIYLDNAATTRQDPAVTEAMLPYFSEYFLNPSAFYQPAVRVRMAVENARKTIAGLIGAEPSGIFFTSGGTESDNWALRMAAYAGKEKGRHIISTSIEHPAVRNTLRFLESEGFSVTLLPPDEKGRIRVEDLEQALRQDTILISVMHANNETGTLQPVEEIGRIAESRGILFHTDAVQTFGHVPIDLSGREPGGSKGIRLLSASAHKLNGPKGIGLLYIRPGSGIGRLLYGGSQEKGLRPGTENVPSVIGFARAAELARERMEQDRVHMEQLRTFFIDGLMRRIPGIRINGSEEHRLPGIISATFPFRDAETTLILLDREGILASAGSACAAGAIEPSHVLTAMGLSNAEARRTVRFSLGRNTTKEELKKTLAVLQAQYMEEA